MHEVSDLSLEVQREMRVPEYGIKPPNWDRVLRLPDDDQSPMLLQNFCTILEAGQIVGSYDDGIHSRKILVRSEGGYLVDSGTVAFVKGEQQVWSEPQSLGKIQRFGTRIYTDHSVALWNLQDSVRKSNVRGISPIATHQCLCKLNSDVTQSSQSYDAQYLSLFEIASFDGVIDGGSGTH